MAEISIDFYTDGYCQQVIDLILTIQRNEFSIPITLDDQPDLQAISRHYQKNKGNFWIALDDGKVIGTISLTDIGYGLGALRKMFVRKDHRGKESGVAQELLNTLLDWARSGGMKSIFLGTTPALKAAHRFYEKNGFGEISANDLPPQFPRMKVDKVFYVIHL